MTWSQVGSALRSAGTWLKVHWKAVFYGLLGILGLFVGISVWKKIQVVFAPVPKDSSKARWMRLDGDDRAIAVQVPGSPEVKTIPLPDGQTSDKVTAVGYDAKKQIVTVEVTHEEVDRRGAKPVPGSTFDALAGKGGATDGKPGG